MISVPRKVTSWSACRYPLLFRIAATLAGALKLKDELKGKKVVLVLSGGNLTYEELLKSLK